MDPSAPYIILGIFIGFISGYAFALGRKTATTAIADVRGETFEPKKRGCVCPCGNHP